MENDQLEVIETPQEVIETPEVIKPPEKEETLRETIKTAAKEARDRDETGKFKQKAEKTDEKIVKTIEPKKAAPQGWTPTAKEKWDTLPPDIQAEVIRREEDNHKAITRLDDERSLGKSMREIIIPYSPMLDAEGLTPQAVVKDLLTSVYVLKTGTPEQKINLLRNVARQYGVDLNQAIQPQQQMNPQLQGIQNELENLKRERQQEVELKKQEENARVQTEINAFAADPKNVHFAQVKADMASLLGSGRAKDMQEAYDMACWSRSDIRPSLLQKQTEDGKRTKEIAAKKAAAASVTGSPGISPNSTPERSLRDEIRANLREAASS